MKLFVNGDGGEFCVGRINSKQADYIFGIVEKDDDNNHYVYMEEAEFWEGNILKNPWYEFEDIVHQNSVNGQNWWISNEKGQNLASADSKETGMFEIDLNNDNRFEMFDDNRKCIIGWDHISAYFDKGFHTLKSKDFSNNNLEHFQGRGEFASREHVAPCLVGTMSYERGYFWEIEVPSNFDKSKLIIISAKFHFTESHLYSFVTDIVYDGKILDKEFVGETNTKDLYHFLLECNIDKDDGEVDFDYALEWRG